MAADSFPSIDEKSLYDDAWLGTTESYQSKLQFLASMAKNEEWNFVDEKYKVSDKQFPILENYLTVTYERLKEEEKLAVSKDEQHMCFNTSLQTEYDQDIFAYFIRNKDYPVKPQKWYFVKFCVSSDRSLSHFSSLPDIAHYFDNPADLLLDKRFLPIRIKTEHIIEDNFDRFSHCGDIDKFDLNRKLQDAVSRAENKVKRNYKVAIPQFYRNKSTGESKIQLLLPLCVATPNRVDLALVVEKENDAYIATTVLPLDWAYMNSRRIARPDSEWIDIMFKRNS